MNFEIDRSKQEEPSQQHQNIDGNDQEDIQTKSTFNRTDEFLKTFNQQIKNYQSSLNPNELTLIKSSLNSVAKELPSYHLKNCMNLLSSLSTIQSIEKETKKKFSFKRNQSISLINQEEECKTNQEEECQINQELKLEEESIQPIHDFQISNQTGILFKPTENEVQFQSFLINHISSSILDLRNWISLKSISIQTLINSILILDNPLDGSLQISFSSNSILIFSSNQIRVHDSKSLWFWIDCKTNPIIERSKTLTFNSKHQIHPIKQVLDFSQPILIEGKSLNYKLNSINSVNQFNEILKFINQFKEKDNSFEIQIQIEKFIKEFMKNDLNT